MKTSQLTFQGDKINLRKLRKADAMDIYQNAKDKEIAQFTYVPHPYTLKDGEEYVRSTQKNIRKGKTYALGIELKSKKSIVGTIALMNVDMDNKNAEIGYWLGKPYWGGGIMKEAISLILEFGFETLGLERIYAKVFHPNISSARLLERSGFSYEGTFRKSTLRGGKWMNDMLYAILKEEFERSSPFQQ